MNAVMIARGKNQDHWETGFLFFEDIQDAYGFCRAFNKKYMDAKYWACASLVTEGFFYEVDAEKCFDGEIVVHGSDEIKYEVKW